eukprot:481512_1
MMAQQQNAPNTNNPPSQQEILSQFESLLKTVVESTSSGSRASAEEQLSAAKQSNLLLYLECLLQVALRSSNKHIKQVSIVMFRQSVQPNNTKAETWNKIPTTAYDALCTGLLTALTKESDLETYIIMCDAIGTFASRLLPQGHWKNLLKDLLALANDGNNPTHSLHKQGFLRVLDCLAEYCIDFLRPNFRNIYAVIERALSDNEKSNVRLTAYKSFISIVISLDKVEDLNKWKSLIPQCVSLLLSHAQSDDINEILSCTIDLVSHRFQLVESVLDDALLPAVVWMARNDSLCFETRKLAFEILVVMGARNAAVLRQHAEYMRHVVQVSMHYLSLYDDESCNFSDCEDDIEQEYVWNARQWCKELCSTLGGAAYLSVAEAQIGGGLESRQWKECYASLQTLIQLIPFIKEMDGWRMDDDNSNCDVLVPQILGFATGDHHSARAEVQHSAWFVMKTLINHFPNAFEERYSEIFYPAALEILMNYKSQHFRVLTQCVKCISHFHSNGAQQSQFRDFWDIILKHLLQIITSTSTSASAAANEGVIGHCVTCCGTCADVMQSYFLQYYDKFMPQMLAIIGAKKAAASGTLRGKAMECIGIIGESVGRVRFEADAHKLTNVLLVQNRAHDEAYNYENQLFARISRCIGDAFTPYLSRIIPDILSSASLEAAQMLKPSDAAPSDPRYSVFTVHLRGIGDTKFCINPISLDEKDTACHMLYQFVKDQCDAFFAYVVPTARTMSQLMRYEYNARVRTAATTIVPLLLKCVIRGVNRLGAGQRPNADFFDALFASFLDALSAEPDVCETVPLLEILAQIAAVIGDDENHNCFAFSDQQLSSIARVLCTILSESSSRKRDRMRDESGAKLIVDEEKRNEILWANDVESELIAHCIDVIEFTFRCEKTRFSAFFEESGAAKICKQMLFDCEGDETQKLQSLCIFIDCCEYGAPQQSKIYLKWLFPFIVDKLSAQDDKEYNKRLSMRWVFWRNTMSFCIS